nr:MAG: putative RNA-dependent RNA polymerase [Partitiviridae sp.]
MCFTVNRRLLQTNLVRLKPIRRKPNWVEPIYKRQQINKFAESIIKKAIHKTCDPVLATQAIHGFRRSQGGDDAAEKDFLRSDVPYFPVNRDFHYRKALRVVEQMFRPSRVLQPISFPDLRFYPWNLSVSAEAPYTVDKRWKDLIREKQRDGEIDDGNMSFHNLYNEIFDQNRILIHQIKDGHPAFWNEDGTPKPHHFTTLHTRAHLVKQEDDDKLRAVFGVPKLLLMAENMFIWNLQKEYLNGKVKSPMLWGFETFRAGWMKLLTTLKKGKNNSYISTDWSGFDRFALFEIIDDVHTMWRSWFDFDHGYEPTASITHPEGTKLGYPTSATKSIRLQRLWDWMTWSVKHTPIRAMSGNVYQWRFNGIASGYQQTQLLDSFVNAIMVLTTLSALGVNIESENFILKVQGDDSVCSMPERIHQIYGKKFLELMAQEAKTRFNATLSTEKTTFSDTLDDIEVLSYKNREGMAYRDEAELLAHLLYPERGRSLEDTAAACVGIAYASMGCSRQVYEACKDAFVFLTVELGRKPSIDWLYKWLNLRGKDVSFLEHYNLDFPTFEECWSQNFDYGTRTEKAKQQLWPTKPTGDYGFYFINQ